MKKTIALFASVLLSISTAWAQGGLPKVESVKLDGYLGHRIDDCITKRVLAQDVDHLIEPFTKKDETHAWQSEFLGKWMLGAIASYQYTRDPKLYDKIAYAANGLLQTQMSDGYIGNYSEEAQLEQWDIWGRKYSLLGLLGYYDLSGNEKALTGAKKLMDHLLTQVGPRHRNLMETGNYRGMPSSSILEPVMYLYNKTGETRYLDFACYIVEQWETEKGPGLISKALDNIPVGDRFTHPDVWWSWDNGQKAYEMMSCYIGLLELYKVTHNPLYLHVVEKVANNIIENEINIAGSGSAFECWYGGAKKQTIPTYHTMETCVTFTWMQLCSRLLELTGNTLYADQIEKSAYNALMASLKGDGTEITKYSPLEGCRHAGEEQCGMHINCCNANGPRAFALLPAFSYQATNNRINVNLYAPSTARIQIGGKNEVELTQTTEYPLEEEINIKVMPQHNTAFSLALRIPAWSKKVSLLVNGKPVDEPIVRGSYCVLHRKWSAEDRITLTLDLRAKVVELNNNQAIQRGPVLLARDSRFNDGDIDESSVLIQEEGYIEVTPVVDESSFSWMAFSIPTVLGAELESNSTPRQIKVCDFASAGNNWDKQQRYRVWLTKTLNVMHSPYKKY